MLDVNELNLSRLLANDWQPNVVFRLITHEILTHLILIGSTIGISSQSCQTAPVALADLLEVHWKLRISDLACVTST